MLLFCLCWLWMSSQNWLRFSEFFYLVPSGTHICISSIFNAFITSSFVLFICLSTPAQKCVPERFLLSISFLDYHCCFCHLVFNGSLILIGSGRKFKNISRIFFYDHFGFASQDLGTSGILFSLYVL